MPEVNKILAITGTAATFISTVNARYTPNIESHTGSATSVVTIVFIGLTILCAIGWIVQWVLCSATNEVCCGCENNRTVILANHMRKLRIKDERLEAKAKHTEEVRIWRIQEAQDVVRAKELKHVAGVLYRTADKPEKVEAPEASGYTPIANPTSINIKELEALGQANNDKFTKNDVVQASVHMEPSDNSNQQPPTYDLAVTDAGRADFLSQQTDVNSTNNSSLYEFPVALENKSSSA